MRAVNHSLRLTAASILTMVLGSYVFATNLDAAEVRDITKINSGVSIDAEQSVGDVSSVNGRIRIARGASAYDLGTVNGSIEIENEVSIEDAETVNGRIRLGEDVTVNGSVSTVNGSIRARAGTVIEDHVKTVNGKIELHNTVVGENVQTSNGDIELRQGSTVEGDVVVRGRRSWFARLFSFGHQTPSDLVVDSSSAIRGDIHLYREVNLRIDDDAQVGEIIYHY